MQLNQNSVHLPARTDTVDLSGGRCGPVSVDLCLAAAGGPDSIASFNQLVEDELEGALVRRDVAPFIPPECVVLLRELWQTACAGGKRVRPLFCLWGYRAARGREEDRIARPAAAIELLHTAALVEDDVFDHARSRRGEPAMHVRLRASLGCSADVADALAILAANLAVVVAEELLLSSTFTPRRLLTAHRHFAAMRAEMVGGELLDLLAADFDERTARRTAQLKCASYTVAGPLLIGAALAGAPQDILKGLNCYGRRVGEAFQLRDDLSGLDSRNGADVEAIADLREGARTFVTATAFRRGDRTVRDLFRDAHGSPQDDTEVEALRRALLDSGAVAETEALIGRLVAEASVTLNRLPIEADVKTSLLALAELCADGQYA